MNHYYELLDSEVLSPTQRERLFEGIYRLRDLSGLIVEHLQRLETPFLLALAQSRTCPLHTALKYCVPTWRGATLDPIEPAYWIGGWQLHVTGAPLIRALLERDTAAFDRRLGALADALHD